MKVETPLLVSSAALIVLTVGFEMLAPVTSLAWLLVRIAVPLVVLVAISWAFSVFLRAGILPRWYPSEWGRPRDWPDGR